MMSAHESALGATPTDDKLEALAWRMRARTAESMVEMLAEAVTMAGHAIIDLGGDPDGDGIRVMTMLHKNVEEWKKNLAEVEKVMV